MSLSRFLTFSCYFALSPLAFCLIGEDPDGAGVFGEKLPFIEHLQLESDDMRQVTSIVMSKDGKQAYAAAFGSNTVTIIDRNPKNGELKVRESLQDPSVNGLVAFRLSPDQSYGAGSGFGSNSLVLYARDLDSGALEQLDHIGGAANPIPGLNFCVDNAFSSDSRFIYTIGSQAICVFEIVGKRLQQVQSFTLAPDENGRPQLSDGRGISVSHDGKWVFSAWQGSGTLVVCRRDRQTGKLRHVQTLKDQPHLRGVMRLTVSSDDSFIYTSSGRFNGNNAVSVFSVNDLGMLTPVQSLGPNALPQKFDGGNEIVISPDGRDVMVACTRSDHLTHFSRNPLSGKLKAIDCRQSGEKATPGAAGVAFSPDGGFVLVADEDSHSIVSFKRVR